MVTKASNSVLNLVDPPIENLGLREGIFDNVVIGEHVPNEAFFTELIDTSLTSAWPAMSSTARPAHL
jgi:hypothetical protein